MGSPIKAKANRPKKIVVMTIRNLWCQPSAVWGRTKKIMTFAAYGKSPKFFFFLNMKHECRPWSIRLMIMWYIPPNPDTQLPESLYHHFFIDSSRLSIPKSKTSCNSTESGEEPVKKNTEVKISMYNVRHGAWIRWKELGSCCWSKFNARRGHKRMKRCCISIFFSKYCSFCHSLNIFFTSQYFSANIDLFCHSLIIFVAS